MSNHSLIANDPVSFANTPSTNIYRVGDYVYFENSISAPYAIRRIEELTKTSNGNVEARAMCFFRRSEIPASLICQADKHHFGDDNDMDDSDDDDERFVHAKQREVFLTRQVETLPATLIRGKCSVTLLSEVETFASYGQRNDAFFYALVFDQQQRTLLADRGEIRIGPTYQAVIPKIVNGFDSHQSLKELTGDTLVENEEQAEEMLWSQKGSMMKTADIEKFLIICRSVGTFARALDCTSSVKQPSLHMSAAAASRDVTLAHAYNLLHQNNYNIADALSALVPLAGPVLCRDAMEDWSTSEANLFEEALEKYGKDFIDIKKDFLPWKSMKNIIEYFFMWKTTDRYVQQKRIKALEAESKLKQVYVPPYSGKSCGRLAGMNGETIIRGSDCEAFGKVNKFSWIAYKKYGKLVPTQTIDDAFIVDIAPARQLNQMRTGLEPTSVLGVAGIMGGKPGSGKTRAAFFLRTSPLTRASRRICPHLVRLRHHARKPGQVIDFKMVKAETAIRVEGQNIRALNKFKCPTRTHMADVISNLGQKDTSPQDWLILTPRNELPHPAVEFYPRPPKRSDGSYIYDRVGGPTTVLIPPPIPINQPPQLYPRKRAADLIVPQIMNGIKDAGVSIKAARMDGRGHVPNVVPPKGRVATLTRIQGGHKQIVSWMDAPDDVFYWATIATKKARKILPVHQIRRAARKPFKKVLQIPTGNAI